MYTYNLLYTFVGVCSIIIIFAVHLRWCVFNNNYMGSHKIIIIIIIIVPLIRAA